MNEQKGYDFGDVRSLVGGRPSAQSFASLCDALEEWPDARELERVILPYVMDHMRRWDPALCILPPRWFKELIMGRVQPYMRIARGLSFQKCAIGPSAVRPLGEMLEGFDLVTLDMTGARITDRVLGRLLEQPFIRGIRALRLRDNEIGEGGFIKLVRSESLSGLERLDIGGNALYQGAMTELAKGVGLRNLTELRLDGARMGTVGIERLAQAAFFANLHTLTLKRANVGDGGLRALSRSPLDSIRRLDLSGNTFCPEGMRVLMASHQLTGLEELRLNDGATMGEEGIMWLAESEHLGSLKKLTFAGSGCTALAIEALGREGVMSELEELDVRGSSLNAGALEAIASARFAGSLRRLKLSSCDLGSNALDGLLGIAQMPALEELSLDRNTLGAHCWSQLCAKGSFPSLTRLDVSDCALGARALDDVRDAVWSKGLVTLDMSGTAITPRPFGVREGAFASLETLTLSRCSLDHESVPALVRRDDYPSLRVFDLSHNDFKGEGGRALSRGRWFGKLRRLSLNGCKLDATAVKELVRHGVLEGLDELDVRDNFWMGMDSVYELVTSPQLERTRVVF